MNSILQQDPGADQMQIEVIDDASPNGAPTEFIRKLAGKRVTLVCAADTQSIAHTIFNSSRLDKAPQF